MNRTLEHILPRVQKPARYTGGEYNAVVKDRRAVDVRYALCFPDTYEIGMSNLGVRILYGLMNEMDGVWCERVFAPLGRHGGGDAPGGDSPCTAWRAAIPSPIST